MTTRCSVSRRLTIDAITFATSPTYATWVLLEIEHFFTVYKDLEPGKSVEGATWAGVEEAEEEIRASFARAKEHDPYGGRH